MKTVTFQLRILYKSDSRISNTGNLNVIFRNKHFQTSRNDNISTLLISDKGFKGTIINRLLQSLHGGSLSLRMTPLKTSTVFAWKDI